ncbi:protein FAM89A-like isoform X1 [Varroa jacobsoni]|uniref:Uncharacterized protein n=1 Tax=Varroa destructor TaxID=109461 RepID=A0A7M7KJW3_VARDE|nr:protein FAM89A-like isoform X2 [Varroa destructor]XP_022710695.1 protein FAM89A-like isoform X1 [Varroa jacobsoni]
MKTGSRFCVVPRMDPSSLAGMPALPRSLRSLLNFNAHQLREMGRAHVMRARMQQQQQDEKDNRHSQHNQNRHVHRPPSPTAGWNGNTGEQANGIRRMSSGGQRTVYDNQDPVLRLEAKMTLLRREMVALRQTDLSLLCQLWSVNEMLQDMKQNGELEELFDEEALETPEAQQAYLEYRKQLHEYNQLLEKHQASFREAGTLSEGSSSEGVQSALGSPDK